MRGLIATNPNNWAAFFIRLALGIVLFPHGAQKLLGWFGGYGYTGTMGFLTTQAHLPWIFAFLVIIIEFFGALFLVFGFLTRLAAFAIFVNFLGILYTSHLNNGFFMNWAVTPNKPEGFEYHILVIGICLGLMISGGGKWSIDAILGRHPSNVRHSNVAIA